VNRRYRTLHAATVAVVLGVILGLPLATADTAGAMARATVPVEPDRNTARAWAAEELSGREYREARPGLLAQVAAWLQDQLERLERLPGFTGTGSKLAVLVVVLVAIVAVLVAVQRSGGLRRQTRVRQRSVFSDRTLSAADHRTAAEAAERSEDWATAVVERFRTVTRELEERAVLVPQPGRTADEVASDAGAWLPGLAQQLRAGATLFDDVRYGGRPAEPSAAAALRGLDEAVRRAKPVAEAAAMTGGLVAPS
jgi:hypothetical protein